MDHIFNGKTDLSQFFESVVSYSNIFGSIKKSHVIESLCCAFGFNTKASAYASLEKNNPVTWHYKSFLFINRLWELTRSKKVSIDDILVLNEIAKGADIKIDIEKGMIRERPGYIPVVVHKVMINVTGNFLNPDRTFILPHHKNKSLDEPYRVDHASFHRVDEGKFAITRNHSGRQLLTGRMKDNEWIGELFVYSSIHVNDDTKMCASVKRSLLRAVGSTLSSEVSVRIYIPDSYYRDHLNKPRAYRVEINLGSELTVRGITNISFKLPDIEQAKFYIPDEKYKIVRKDDIQNMPYDALFSGGTWCGDLYFYDRSPDRHDESQIKFLILREVHNSLSRYIK